MGVRQGEKLGGGGGGRKFTRFFPIVPNLLKKCPVVNFPKILSARVEGYRQKNYHGLLQFLVSFSLFLYFQMLCFICPFLRLFPPFFPCLRLQCARLHFDWEGSPFPYAYVKNIPEGDRDFSLFSHPALGLKGSVDTTNLRVL